MATLRHDIFTRGSEHEMSANPSPKCLRVTDYLEKLPQNTMQREFPEFLKHYHPTDYPLSPSCSKSPVGKLRKSSKTDSERHADTENSLKTLEVLTHSGNESQGKQRGCLPIVELEAEA